MQPKITLGWIIMVYKVRADNIAKDIDSEAQKSILDFLQTYDFPYVTCIKNKASLREVFSEHFRNRHDLGWLRRMVYPLAQREGKDLRGVASVAWSETNRLHTVGLGNLLLSKGIKECTTVHTYGSKVMSLECYKNLEGKHLDIKEIIRNSFPEKYGDLMRQDIPMIPQHVNCRHVMAPID